MVDVTVTDTTTGEVETVTLTESGVDTGVFQGSLPTSTTLGAGDNNGTLLVAGGDNLSVSYTDPTDPGDTSADTAAVTATLQAPPAPTLFDSLVQDRIQWEPVNGAIAYNLYRGDLGMLRTMGQYTQDPATTQNAGRFCFMQDTSFEDTFLPPVGEVVFYMVTADNGTVEGSLGVNAAGEELPNDHPCR